MAQVPKSEGHRGGITAFVLDYTSDGVSVTHRNQFMGLHGIENSVTLLEDVFVLDNDDDANYTLAQQVLEGRHTWIDEGIADPAGDGPMLGERPAEVSRTG
jgi:alkylation response protein AidB-like acyl-CoA dehydrogenase